MLMTPAARRSILRPVTVWQRRVFGLPVPDVALAAVLVVYGQLDVWLTHEWHGGKPLTAVVVFAMAASLAWRRAEPLVTVVVPAGGLVLLSLVYGGSEAGANLFVLLAAAYSVALYGPNPPATFAAFMAAAIVHTARTPEVSGVGDALWEPLMLTLAFGVGLAMRSRQSRADEREHAAAEEERRRIARELHDIVSHGLGVMVLQAGAADQVLDRDPEHAREALRAIRTVGLEAIGEMETLLGLIRGDGAAPLAPQPTLRDLDALVAKMRKAGLDAELEIVGEPRPLAAALELSAYRIVQEGLTNALKHAGPSRARVTLRYREHDLQVEVADDGSGALGLGSGVGSRRGLAGIGERVAVFGGMFEAGPRSDGGWTVRAGFPIAR
jgi:signal transduction histidine kinase